MVRKSRRNFMSFRIIAKLVLALVIFGFCMPVACDMTGLQIANFYMENDGVLNGLLMYVSFISAIAGVAIGGMLLIKKRVDPKVDWTVIIVCVVSGLIVYFGSLNESSIKLQTGAYVILAGWIAAVAAQIYSKIKGE